VLAAHGSDREIEPVVCLTGQHPHLAREALAVFDVTPDITLDCVQPGGDLCHTVSSVVSAVGRLLDKVLPDVLIVQGDTVSAMAGGLAAALRRVPLAHVEAGLRSGDMKDPFPEELSRRQLSHLAQWHFAPTQRAVYNLLVEGIAPASIYRVGNTVIDALRVVRDRLEPGSGRGRSVLITAHRRENWGEPMMRICAAVARLARIHADVHFVFSLHPNPKLQRLIRQALVGIDNVELIVSPGYAKWARYLVRCDFILTDSGGLQEEGSAIGKPILVLRETTERPEATEAGNAVLVGTRTDEIIKWAERLLTDSRLYRTMSRPNQVFGDGYAAERIVRLMADTPLRSAPFTKPIGDKRDEALAQEGHRAHQSGGSRDTRTAEPADSPLADVQV